MSVGLFELIKQLADKAEREGETSIASLANAMLTGQKPIFASEDKWPPYDA